MANWLSTLDERGIVRRPVGPMSATVMENQRDHADLALVVYLEELLRDRRVLLVGDTSARVERRLSDAARTVDVVVAPSASAAGSRERRVRRRGLPLRAWPTPAEKGTWDAIIIPDLVAAGLSDSARFDEIAALVPDGILIAAIDANGDEPSYEAFYALVSARFEGSRMLGQAPLSGYALAELGATTADVAYDASSAELAPARFVAVAAPRSVAIDGYAVIATPRVAEAERAAPVEPRHEREAEAVRTRLEHSEKRLEQAQREIARNAQKLDEARHEQVRLEDTLRAQQADVEADDTRESASVRAARDECDVFEGRLRAAAREVTSLRAENERRGVLVRDLVEELRRNSTQASLAVVPSRGEVDAELGRAQEALSTAQRRAVEAEARRAELAFRVDELTADLASIGQTHDARTAQLVREHAASQGAAHGLLAQVGELSELRLVAESRLALVEDDLRRSRDQSRDLERRLGEMEEQLEVARMQRPGAPVESGGDPAREGQLFGALLKAREELAALRDERIELVGEVARLRTALEIAAHEGDAGLAEARRRASALEAEANLRAGQLEHRNTELANVREERDSLATRVVALESVIPPPMAAEPVRDEALEQELDAIRGECAGLTLRAQNADAAADAALERARALEAKIATSEAAARADARRAAELASKLAARDALVSRLQTDLGHVSERHAASERTATALEARLASASESIGAIEAVSSVRSDEERRERDAIVIDLSSERTRAARLDTERASALEALRDVRESLARLQAGLAEPTRGGASIPTAPEGIYREEIARLARDADDREVMLRSLTAQLEERDDRIRALERVARGDTASVDATKRIETEERVARLTAELAEERRARERVEAASASVSREAELRRLEQLIGDRDAQMMLLEGRVEGASREERAMRDVFAEARASIETILAHLGGDRQGEAVEHAAELLRSLRKY